MRHLREHVELKSLDEIGLMREAGLVVARALVAMRDAVEPGVTTRDLDAIAREILSDEGATSSFLNYGFPPYPAVICASVNADVVHGIPSEEAVLREGDLISIDFGAIVEGWHGDAAITVPVGSVSAPAAELSEACRKSLWDGIVAARAGGRLSDISHAVERSVRASGSYGIVTGYGGHGIGSQMHMDPHVPIYGRPGRGPHLVAGMALAVEPMITLGSAETRERPDIWTIATADGSLAAHWEHTVAILDDGPWVLTAEDGGQAELAERGVTLAAAALSDRSSA
jgi:methionyl aminopeptidase